MRINKLFYFILLTISTVVYSQNCADLDSLYWIVGEWQSESDKSITTETWVKLSQNTYDRISRTVSKKENQTAFVETLRLLEMSAEIFFLVKVSHNEYPIPFKLTECSDRTAVFENDKHDFPKKIYYQLLDEGQRLHVTVSNEQRQFTVEFERSPNN